MLIKKIGSHREWEDCAQYVGEICSRQFEHIKAMVVGEDATPDNREAFTDFKSELGAATNAKLSDDDDMEILAQHIVIKPVLDELFRGYPFTEKNAVARAMTKMLERLDQDGLTRTNDELSGFYQRLGFWELLDGAIASNLRVTKLKYGKRAGKKGNAALDKTKIVYNGQITISGIPLEVQDYVVNKKSALDWVVERCGVSVDKSSQIVYDFNNMAEEKGDPKYIFHLILRVITVSHETNKIVAALPALRIHSLDQ